ncbi:hypothetical protein V7183_10130 [Bacillus sp. JJ1127]|uniref:hypothetical protein n=1 Tax=Bacillus sp. JJ1127 TaxID=3122952 RepID=UPI002FFFA6FD
MSGKQQRKGYDNRKSDRKLERMKREMAKQKRKVAKGEPRKAVIYLHSSEQQLKDIAQENRDLRLEVDMYKSQAKNQESYVSNILNENKELHLQVLKWRGKFLVLAASYMVVAVIISFVIAK